MSIDLTNYGTLYAKQFYGLGLKNDDGGISLDATAASYFNTTFGILTLDGADGVEIGSNTSDTTVKGNLTVEGALSFTMTGNLGADTLTANTLTANTLVGTQGLNVTGLSDLNGALDVSGQVDLGASGGYADTTVRGDLAVDEDLTITGNSQLNALDVTGNLNVEPSGNLNGAASSYNLIFGTDNSEGSWRINVGNDNKMHFERHNGTTWVVKAHIG